jgi:hypothetical protein
LYSEAQHVAVEAQVVFEDGRQGLLKADLAIRDLAPVDVEVGV